MRVVDLPCLEHTVVHNTGASWMASLAEAQKNYVKEFVSKIKAQTDLSLNDSPRLAGFVLDTFVLGMNDLAAEFGVPWYVFSASGATFITLMLHLQALHDEQKADLPEYKDSDAELEIPSLVNKLPAKLLPSLVFNRESLPIFLGAARRLKHARCHSPRREGALTKTLLGYRHHAWAEANSAAVRKGCVRTSAECSARFQTWIEGCPRHAVAQQGWQRGLS